MSSRGQVVVSLMTTLAMLVVSGPVRPADLFAEGGPPAAQYTRSLTVKPGSVNGQVLYPDGETPARWERTPPQ